MSSQKLDFVNNSLLTVWSYFSFSDKERDKSDHLVSAWFSWSLSSKEILTPQLQDDGAVSFACCWISLTMLHTQTWRELSVVLLSYLWSKCTNFCMLLTKNFIHVSIQRFWSVLHTVDYFCDICFIRRPSVTSQKLEKQGYNLMPSRDKTWISSIDNESETYGVKECLLDLSQHRLGHQVGSESRSVIQHQWRSTGVCLFNDNN